MATWSGAASLEVSTITGTDEPAARNLARISSPVTVGRTRSRTMRSRAADPDISGRSGAVARGSNDEAFGLQPPLDEGRDGGFLLNDQQVHEHPFRPNVPSSVILPADGPFLPSCWTAGLRAANHLDTCTTGGGIRDLSAESQPGFTAVRHADPTPEAGANMQWDT